MFRFLTVLVATSFLVAISASTIRDDDHIIELLNPAGSTLKGHTMQTDDGLKYYAYHDIPYAEPPVGENRFNVPVYSKGWKGTLNATKLVKICTQAGGDRDKLTTYGAIQGTEDCLVVNVYTPKNPKTSKSLLPVLVWIHGGGFMFGSGGDFIPQYFMEENVIVVTVNYRLGVFGFLSTQDKVIPGNYGFKDQQLAIEWTYNNIKAFGGDPEKITISGESAGAVSIGRLLLNENQRINKFFRGAILASGTGLVPFGARPNAREEAFNYGYKLDSSFKSNNSEDLLKLLKSTSAEKLIGAMDLAVFENPFIGAVEFESDEFNRPPTDSMDHGVFVRVPTLIGFNSEELLGMYGDLDDVKKNANRSAVDTLLSFGFRMKNMTKMQEMASHLEKRYTNTSFPEDLPAFIRFSSDMEFTAAVFRHVVDVNIHAPEVSPYLYRFSYKPSFTPDSVVPGIEGVSHGTDLSILFNMDNVTFTETDKKMSRKIVRLWSNFARDGEPTPKKDPLFGNVIWPKSKKSSLLAYLDLNEEMTIEENPRDFTITRDIMEKYLDRPIYGF